MSAPGELAPVTLPSPPVVPQSRRHRFPWKTLAGLSLLIALAGGSWASGFPRAFWGPQADPIETVAVTRGDIAVYLAESGVVESTSNATVKCQVEALLGSVSTNTNGSGGMGRNGGGGSGGSGAGGASGSGGASATGTMDVGKTGSAKGATGKGAAGGGSGADGGSGAATTKGSSGGRGSTTAQKPMVQSFNYMITPHVSTKVGGSSGNSAAGTTKKSQNQQSQSGGFSMSGGERNGSTTILTILPEGTPVKAGQVVCELDKATFEDELRNQRIRYDQAKAAYDQVEYAAEVNKIAIQEYINGVLPQDREAIRIYGEQCKSLAEQARKTYEWSKSMEKKGFRSASQVQADFISVEQNDLNQSEAERMKIRLEDFASPRILKELEAKGESIRADLLSKKSTVQLEEDRRERLQKAIANCTLKAPHDGIICYVNEVSPWGSVDYEIEPGAVVREGQAIFNLPNSKDMRIRCRVNETKVSKVRIGMPVKISIDAIPDRVFDGKVTEVTAIPAPAEGPISEIHVYYAMIEIDTQGYEGFKPGLSALIHFAAEFQNDVPLVPVSAVRWIDRAPFLAVLDESGASWRPVALGVTNEELAEVKSGVKEGDRVVLNPEDVPALATNAPGAPRAKEDAGQAAGADPAPTPVRTASSR
jgi:HlyD family secretion protein